MKKMRSSIIILFLVGLIAIVPLAGAACSSSSTGSDGPFTWEMQAPYAETDASGIALTKFKELAEDLTDGRITINANYNGTPVAHTSQFAALQSNALDLAVQQPGYSREVSNNFDFSGALAGLIVTKEHYQDVLADKDYSDWYSGLYKAKNIKYLGTIDGYRFAGGLLTTFKANSLDDLVGHSIYNGRSGALEPYEEALGCSTHVYYDRTELNGAIAGGQVDIVAMPLALAYSSSMYLAPYFKSHVVRPFYAPYSILMSLSDWEAMNSELQDIITDEVMPDLTDYMSTKMIEESKASLKGMVDAKGADFFLIFTASDEDDTYNTMVDLPSFNSRAAGMDQDMYKLIKDLRPAHVVWDQDLIDVIDYAGLS